MTCSRLASSLRTAGATPIASISPDLCRRCEFMLHPLKQNNRQTDAVPGNRARGCVAFGQGSIAFSRLSHSDPMYACQTHEWQMKNDPEQVARGFHACIIDALGNRHKVCYDTGSRTVIEHRFTVISREFSGHGGRRSSVAFDCCREERRWVCTLR